MAAFAERYGFEFGSLAELEFIGRAENIVLIGPTAVGKTGLASCILLKALQNGHRGLFIRAQDLFDQMYASLADRASRKLIDRLARVDVLLIDEMGYLNLKPEQINIFFRLMEERYGQKPTIITTNLDYPEWDKFLGNPGLVKAMLSRLRHHCHTIRIDGPELREPQGQRAARLLNHLHHHSSRNTQPDKNPRFDHPQSHSAPARIHAPAIQITKKGHFSRAAQGQLSRAAKCEDLKQ